MGQTGTISRNALLVHSSFSFLSIGGHSLATHQHHAMSNRIVVCYTVDNAHTTSGLNEGEIQCR